jgi:chemotaxis protein MotB
MPVDDKTQPIVIKKIKKQGHGHHGGAWKVAYADFVTAMMAFFLLMWLMGTVDTDKLHGISEVFQSPSAIEGPGGASTSLIELGGALELPKGEGEPLRQMMEPVKDAMDMAEDRADETRLDELMQQLKEQIEATPSLKAFKEQLLLDITSEGLRIQIVDREKRPMFDLGGDRLKNYTQEILRELGKTLARVPNRVSISGHTDATPFGSDREYSNWELSADRANAARRELVNAGMADNKFGRVVGLASSVLFNKVDPFDPVNRRISIVVMNKATERAIGMTQRGAPPAAVPLIPESAEGFSEPVSPLPFKERSESLSTPAVEPDPLQQPAAGAGENLEEALERLLGPPSRQ